MLQKDVVAVIDVGSNSIKLLIARKNPKTGLIESSCKEGRETRISTGIGQQKPTLTQGAIAAGCQSIVELVGIARKYSPRVIKIVATSAVRDAVNGSEFTRRVNELTGIHIDILTGIEEANYIGKGLCSDPKVAAMEQLIQMDIGGGSLELIRFGNGTLQQVCSLQLGAVRLTERFVNDSAAPIPPETESQIEQHVRQAIKSSGFAFGPETVPFIVTGGAFKVIYNILEASNANATTSSPQILQKADIAALRSTLKNIPLLDRLMAYKVPVSRADILPTALITIDTVLECAGCQTVTLSACNLRYGIATELLA